MYNATIREKIDKMTRFERIEHARKGGDMARHLDKWTTEKINGAMYDLLTENAHYMINTYTATDGQFYLDFGELDASAINELALDIE